MTVNRSAWQRQLVTLTNVVAAAYALASLALGHRLDPTLLLAAMGLVSMLVLLVPRRILPKTLLMLATMLVSFPWMLDELAATVVLQHVSAEPWVELAAPDAEVRPGGQTLTFLDIDSRRTLTVTTCYYPGDNGLVVAAAHAVDLRTDRQYPVTYIAPQQVQNGSAYIRRTSAQGILVECHDLRWNDAAALAIAGTADISLTGAEVRSMVGGTFPVEVVGFVQLTDGQHILVRCLTESDRIIPGMSGSPVVQNGKLIGFIYRAFTAGGVSYGEARLAADVYTTLQELVVP